MFLDERKNWDYNPDIPGSGKLHGDHGRVTRAEALRRGIPVPPPDRLLHARCNQQRGDGYNDHLAANRQTAGPEPTGERLLMPWPWLT